MYHPTSRVLAVLELLQSKPAITGPELAKRLEMDVRTVRRYIMHLQDVGIPVEGNIGRHGGYRLRPGYKLPPLLFTEEEGTAIILGLLGTSWLEIGQSSVAVEGALAKVSRVLPIKSRERLNAIASHLHVFSDQQGSRPDISLLLSLSEAIGQQQRVTINYRSYQNKLTERTVEPYGIVGWQGHWFLVAYCCLRKDHRSFRLDRITQAEILEDYFERTPGFDAQTYITKHYGNQPKGFYFEIEFQAELFTVQQKIPASYGTLTSTPTGTLLQSYYESLEGMARYLLYLNFPFVIHNPPELRDALRQLARQMVQIADTPAPAARQPATESKMQN